ncbi:helix-turn-helix domain-containing protein [Pseudomonas congelans]|uniref:helix-turn-helix domain-containing protein n=1 Tax=Pseudomonas congelans TaxID=200452 RepID=UPI001BDC71FC|nr:helix-turn-helix domain-containing protein [Pseudomonas congelans]
MSYSTIDWVYNQKLPAQEKLILVYIAKCENPNEPCFASVKHLANKCGVSTRTIQRVLKDCAVPDTSLPPRASGATARKRAISTPST